MIRAMDPNSLDEAVMHAAREVDPDNPIKVLQRWLNYLPPAAYPFIVAEYRRLTGQPTVIVHEGGRWTAAAHELMRRLR